MGPFGLITVVTAVCLSSVLPPAPAEKALSPESVIDSLQGSWTLDAARSVMLADNTVSEFLSGYRSQLASIRIDKGKLTLERTKSLINLEDAPRLTEQKPAVGHDLVMILRMADGKYVTASFGVNKVGLLLRIPANCCSRSGVWLRFVRPCGDDLYPAESTIHR